MGIGVSIFLIAVGAIFTFAVQADLGAVDITTVGWILMAVGGLGLIMALTVFGSWGRRSTVVEERAYPHEHDHVHGDRVVREERTY